MSKNKSSDIYLNITRLAYTWTRILNTPFWALYTLLPFIILKDLQATPWQIACIISLSPLVSLLSFYWSELIKRRRDRLRSNIIWASVLGHLPFLFIPWIDNPWFFVFASAIYMLFWRGANPAWMEILKINISSESRHHVFAYGSAFYHVGGAILAISMGWIMDSHPHSWRWLFPCTSLFSLLAIFIQMRLPLKDTLKLSDDTHQTFFSWQGILKPWKDGLDLLRKRPDFANFQIGFMLAGSSLMLWKPAAPLFFLDTLHLNFKELAIAITLCKSIGYTLTLPIWTRAMKLNNLFTFTCAVTILTTLFPLTLMIAQWNLVFLYGAYFLYGMMQAGSEMSWNLSGPIFSKHEDSSIFSGVNVVTVGIRGSIVPPIGSFLCLYMNPTAILLIGATLSLLATWQLYRCRVSEELPKSLFSN